MGRLSVGIPRAVSAGVHSKQEPARRPVMINLSFWILVALIYSIFAVWTAKLLLEGIFAAMARANAGPRSIRRQTTRPEEELDQAA